MDTPVTTTEPFPMPLDHFLNALERHLGYGNKKRIRLDLEGTGRVNTWEGKVCTGRKITQTWICYCESILIPRDINSTDYHEESEKLIKAQGNTPDEALQTWLKTVRDVAATHFITILCKKGRTPERIHCRINQDWRPEKCNEMSMLEEVNLGAVTVNINSRRI